MLSATEAWPSRLLGDSDTGEPCSGRIPGHLKSTGWKGPPFHLGNFLRLCHLWQKIAENSPKTW